MENVDPALLEAFQEFLTSGNEQWQMLAEEVARRAKFMAYICCGLFGLSVGFLYLAYRYRQDYNASSFFAAVGGAGSIFGLIGTLVNLSEALAPMNTVLNNILN
jgi:hypothetical protein